MSQQLRQLKTRIRAIDGIWKVTRAMEMVAMSKFKSVEAPLSMTRLYFDKLSSITRNLIYSASDEKHPFLVKKPSTHAPVGLFVISSDAGLCGGYNTHLTKTIGRFLTEMSGREVKLFVLGRKAGGYFSRRNQEPAVLFPALYGKIKPDFHQDFYHALSREFLQGHISELYVAYTAFQNAMKHHPQVQKILPIEMPETTPQPFMIEAGDRGILSEVLPMYLSNRLRLMLMESLTSEYSARMVAMKASKDNAKELMGDLILLRNKIRQAVITKEVVEIISSAEALKG